MTETSFHLNQRFSRCLGIFQIVSSIIRQYEKNYQFDCYFNKFLLKKKKKDLIYELKNIPHPYDLKIYGISIIHC